MSAASGVTVVTQPEESESVGLQVAQRFQSLSIQQGGAFATQTHSTDLIKQQRITFYFYREPVFHK